MNFYIKKYVSTLKRLRRNSMNTIATANQKGGVDMTTFTLNIVAGLDMERNQSNYFSRESQKKPLKERS
jgi:hypothetical protein